MAGSPSIPGFDADAVRAGLRIAMTVGMPVNDSDQPVFFIAQSQPVAAEKVDSGGTPFDPAYVPPRTPPKKVTGITCAIEYFDGAGKIESLGVIVPSKIVLTLLDVDYTQVKGFDYVVVGGRKYLYRSTETPKGLVTVGLYKIHCQAEDEG